MRPVNYPAAVPGGQAAAEPHHVRPYHLCRRYLQLAVPAERFAAR